MAELGRYIKRGIVVGGLEFFSVLLATLITSFMAKTHAICIIIGLLLIVAGLVLLFLAFFKDDPSLRASYCTVGFPTLIMGVTSCCTKASWFLRSNVFTHDVFYMILIFCFVGLLSLAFPYVTKLCGETLEYSQEVTLYIWCNFFLCIFYGLLIGIPTDGTTGKLCSNMIKWSIVSWFIGLIMFALLGVLIESKSVGGTNANTYDSASTYDSLNKGYSENQPSE